MKNSYETIRDLREDNDYTQSKIAEILGISQQSYSRYETGKSEMPMVYIKKLCKFYDVSADYILGLSKEKR
ncbi:MAG: helix-turn-helix transcriptional regulator [Clostridia bacterium]|nr:helix-turn-helix transcriptional regulator [Clostridia bacterium]